MKGVAHLRVLPHSHGETEENHKNPVKIAGNLAENQTKYVPNTSLPTCFGPMMLEQIHVMQMKKE
jgi:hypothetical protein